MPPSAAARARKRATADRAPIDIDGTPYQVTAYDLPFLQRGRVPVFMLDDLTAHLVGELDLAGDYDGVQLLLMPTDGQRH